MSALTFSPADCPTRARSSRSHAAAASASARSELAGSAMGPCAPSLAATLALLARCRALGGGRRGHGRHGRFRGSRERLFGHTPVATRLLHPPRVLGLALLQDRD